jgi:two-component system sensor histidine kinase YesM
MIIMPNRSYSDYNNLPIRYKLIIHFMIISILPSICLGIMVSWAVNNVISKQVNENTLQLIGKANKSLESYVGEVQNITYLISFNPQVQNFLEQDSAGTIDEIAAEDQTYEIRQFLQGFTTLHSEIAGILVINNAGNYISNEMYARSTKILTDETWYKEAVNNHGIFKLIGHPVGRNVTTHYNYKDDEVVSVVRAIVDPETQETKGVILIDLKLRIIAETLKDVRLGKSGFLMVVNDQGSNIYTPANPFSEEIRKEWFAESMSGNFSKKLGGEELQFIYRTSPFTNWTTVGVFSTNEAVYEVQEIRFYLISFIFLVSFLGITASFYLAYSISRPILRLKKYMEIAESGDLQVRDLGNRTDEVGMLGRSFNNMLHQTKKLISLVEVKEREKKDAELRILHANIKPHFLYNTLDTIHWLSKKNGAHEVSELVDSLSKLFRIGLSKGHEIIPLIDEVEHVISYLKIQKTRYKDKLHYEVNIDPNVQKLFLLKLCLQPIVENAIYHGIKERRGPGHIRVEAALQQDHVKMTITDDGLGMDEETLQKLLVKMEQTLNNIRNHSILESQTENEIALKVNQMIGGYGVMNVHTRIVLSFGERYGISIESRKGEGTVVTINHPILTTDEGGSVYESPLEGIDRG